jgi:Domain of unknown function (DUF4845)
MKAPASLNRRYTCSPCREHPQHVPTGLPGRRARTRLNNQRGASHLRAIVWTLVLAALVYTAIKVVPVLITEYQFQDAIQNIARFATVQRKGNFEVVQSVLEEAQKDDLPIQKEDIKVEGAGGNVHIYVNYSVTVDLMVYQWTLNFHPAASNSALL